ncbi:MAG: hypothetical protein Q9209_006813 [Squamulea sp. 1 TL-2023]
MHNQQSKRDWDALHALRVEDAKNYIKAARGEENATYNPFGKIRKASVYAEPEGGEDQKPSDSENFVAELVRRGTKELTFVKYDHGTIDSQKQSKGKKPVVPLLPHVDEEKLPYILEDQPAEAIQSTSITGRQRAFLIWQRWRRKLLGNQWDVRPAIANIATSTIAFAPLSTTGHFLLPASARPWQTVVVEYGSQQSLDPNLRRPAKVRAPLVRTFSHKDEKNRRTKDVFAGLKDLTDEASYFASTTCLRVIYVQDDVKAFKHLISDFHIDSPAFSRNRTNFCDWILGDNMEHLSVWQTAFWRPSYDRSRNVVRAAFGLEYLVPQLHSVSVLEGHSRFSKIPRLKAMVESSDDVHDNSLQRLSIYIQLPRARTSPPSTTEPPADADRFVQANMTSQGIVRAQKDKLACESTVIVLDSHHKALATAPLIAGEEPWQELLDSLEEMHHQSPYRLALAVVELAFESVAARWSHYILSMHNYLASVEERVYENPADDTRTGALWSVSKQLLQAERLLKFHILLLENIQNDFKGLEQEDAMPLDWLQPNLTEFRRLSSEVEETLKKPTAHMVDLMYKSISIRDARQSLQLNTSLWRLSWVTFIFLPLTFLAGFFGMNIQEFHDDPPMKWYFVVAAPLVRQGLSILKESYLTLIDVHRPALVARCQDMDTQVSMARVPDVDLC